MESSQPRPTKDEYFVQMLKLVASRSTCARRAAAAIITDVEGRVLSTGYNGVPKGFVHCTDSPCEGASDPKGDTSRCMAVHAEVNAILQCADLERADTIYCSAAPCFGCAKLIANTKIKRVIYVERYADERGLKVLDHLLIARISCANDEPKAV